MDEPRFSLNGASLPTDSVAMPGGRFRKVNEMYKMASPRHRVMGQWFILAWTLNTLSHRPVYFVYFV
jgi:hypothetical protein